MSGRTVEERRQKTTSDRPSEAAFVGVSALLFAGSTTLTIVWCASMSAMGGMPIDSHHH